MHLLPAIAALLIGATGARAQNRTTPPEGAVVVDATGTYSNYTTVQEGVDALSTTATEPQSLFIYPGVYKEQVYIAQREANLTVYGYTEDVTSYQGNTVNITYDLALINTTTDDLTATVRVWVTNFKMYNINILNTFGHISEDGQNLALSAQKTRQGYYGVGLYGYQDTLLANTGTQLYAKSKIVGAIDFIFGQTALAWLESIDIRTIAAGCVTASGRDAADVDSYYVISNSTISGINATVEAETGINYLGRPWHNYSQVAFQYTYMSDVINSAGWSIWDTGDPRTNDVNFGEYQNWGPGSAGIRANFSHELSAPLTRAQILGDLYLDEFYVDSSYLS